jgi:A/G-specific adenine glycosylase
MRDEPYCDESAARAFRAREDVASYSGTLSPATLRSFRKIILDYYGRYGRDFPWRKTSDPYHIVVSEIMLQQTQTDRVARKFVEFIDRFPTVESLATAEQARVLQVWQGLGYNRRGIMLHRLARQVMNEFGGVIPHHEDVLAGLPGLGRATASSIAVFAFNRPLAFIETNIRAVYIHFFFFDHDSVTVALILPLVEATLVRRSPYRWYSALMDYGSMLKRRHVNPGRKSAHYTRQSAFRGSRRQVRGMIVKLLLERSSLRARELAVACQRDVLFVEDVLGDLEKEGIVKKKSGWYSL